MKQQRHKWKRVDSELPRHHICIYCGLERASVRVVLAYYSTYFFRTDENGNIIEGGRSQTTVPYPCPGPETKIQLPDDLFEI